MDAENWERFQQIPLLHVHQDDAAAGMQRNPKPVDDGLVEMFKFGRGLICHFERVLCHESPKYEVMSTDFGHV